MDVMLFSNDAMVWKPNSQKTTNIKNTKLHVFERFLKIKNEQMQLQYK